MTNFVIPLKIIVTAGLLGAVFLNVDPSMIVSALTKSDLGLLTLAMVLYGLTFIVGGIRWQIITQVYGLYATIPFCLRVFYISGFFSQIVVGGGYGGDVYRVWVLARKTKSKLKSIETVLVDRMSGLMAAVLMIAFLTPVYWLTFPGYVPLLLGISLLCVLVAIMLFLLSWVGIRHTASESIIGSSIGDRVRKLFEIGGELSKGFFTWPATPIHLLWSLLALTMNLLALALIGASMGADVSLEAYFLLGPLVFLAKSIPLSIAGWGTREVAMIYFFGLAGLDSETALAMSLLTGILVLIASSVGGVLWLVTREPVQVETDIT